MIRLDVNRKELDESLRTFREQTIEKLFTLEFLRSLPTDHEAAHEVADALDAQHNPRKLCWAIAWICCSVDAVKIVEAIYRELPQSSRRSFLDNVVVACRHPDSPLRKYATGRRVAAFASTMRRHLVKSTPTRQPPTKGAVMKLVGSCGSAGAKLAVALAAFGGLHPRQVKRLVFGDLVEFSLSKRRFSKIPSRIRMVERVGYRVTVAMFYTFLSSRGCKWMVQDLKTRSRPITAQTPVITVGGFKEAEKAVRAAALCWHDLRDYFHACFMTTMIGSSSMPVDFMLGHMIDEAALTHVWRFFDPARIDWMRNKYIEVEKQFF